MTAMANARSVDIKLKFDPTDMTPGAKGRKFRRDVLLHGGRTDARGFSTCITDCILPAPSMLVWKSRSEISDVPRLFVNKPAGNFMQCNFMKFHCPCSGCHEIVSPIPIK